MTGDKEDEYLGREIDAVPKVEPAEECNGRKTERPEDGDRVFAGYCSLPAGWGVVEGGEDGRRCKLHGGVPGGGAPANNQNATKHGLDADPHHYYQSLPPKEQQFIEELARTIEDRVRENTGSVDHTDRILSRQVAIQVHISTKASKYVEGKSGLVQKMQGRREAAPLLEEVRKYDNSIFQSLKELGVLEDPESAKADSVDSWREFLEGGENSE
ncbi:hypothetical protein [Halobacterium yunchengense]|uniref:hypothetical protein n=1 Tax=Halobacterium yunchengense TaxID=3108497 RepID=UPI003009B5D8